MAKVRVVTKKARQKVAADEDSPRASLPTEKSKPATKIHQFTWLIYGKKKIGKTTLVTQFPKCVMFLFEPGSKAISAFKVPVDRECLSNWGDALSHIKLLKKRSSHPFQTVCFDPGNKAYEMCLRHVCKKLGITHPGKQNDYGASWHAVSEEFQDVHSRLAGMGMAFVVIAHEKSKEIEDPDTGVTYDVIMPRFPGGASDFYEGVIDNIGYYHYVGRRRYLQIRGTQTVVAGTRCQNNFLTPEGAPIFKIPMGDSCGEAFRNIVKAFNNQQKRTYAEDRKGAKKSKKVQKKKK